MSAPTKQKSYADEMNSLLQKKFGLSHDIHGLLQTTCCFIAGGAATHILLGKPVEEFDGDLDIWYPDAPRLNGESSDAHTRSYNDAKTAFDTFMSSLNRKPSALTKEVTEQYLDQDNSLNHVIRKIRSYNHSDEFPPIQVIYAYGDRDQILDSFDFSFCAVGYDPKTGQIFGKDLELTKGGKGYVLNEAKNDTRRAGRLAKYMRRGFKLVPIPSLPATERVCSTLAEKVAAYEEFFASDEHMLVVVGDGGSGKSLALKNAEKSGEVIIYEDNNAKVIDMNDEPFTMSRSIYHLFKADEDLAQALKKKYKACIVRFERDTE